MYYLLFLFFNITFLMHADKTGLLNCFISYDQQFNLFQGFYSNDLFKENNNFNKLVPLIKNNNQNCPEVEFIKNLFKAGIDEVVDDDTLNYFFNLKKHMESSLSQDIEKKFANFSIVFPYQPKLKKEDYMLEIFGQAPGGLTDLKPWSSSHEQLIDFRKEVSPMFFNEENLKKYNDFFLEKHPKLKKFELVKKVGEYIRKVEELLCIAREMDQLNSLNTELNSLNTNFKTFCYRYLEQLRQIITNKEIGCNYDSEFEIEWDKVVEATFCKGSKKVKEKNFQYFKARAFKYCEQLNEIFSKYNNLDIVKGDDALKEKLKLACKQSESGSKIDMHVYTLSSLSSFRACLEKRSKAICLILKEVNEDFLAIYKERFDAYSKSIFDGQLEELLNNSLSDSSLDAIRQSCTRAYELNDFFCYLIYNLLQISGEQARSLGDDENSSVFDFFKLKTYSNVDFPKKIQDMQGKFVRGISELLVSIKDIISDMEDIICDREWVKLCRKIKEEAIDRVKVIYDYKTYLSNLCSLKKRLEEIKKITEKQDYEINGYLLPTSNNSVKENSSSNQVEDYFIYGHGINDFSIYNNNNGQFESNENGFKAGIVYVPILNFENEKTSWFRHFFTLKNEEYNLKDVADEVAFKNKCIEIQKNMYDRIVGAIRCSLELAKNENAPHCLIRMPFIGMSSVMAGLSRTEFEVMMAFLYFNAFIEAFIFMQNELKQNKSTQSFSLLFCDGENTEKNNLLKEHFNKYYSKLNDKDLEECFNKFFIFSDDECKSIFSIKFPKCIEFEAKDIYSVVINATEWNYYPLSGNFNSNSAITRLFSGLMIKNKEGGFIKPEWFSPSIKAFSVFSREIIINKLNQLKWEDLYQNEKNNFYINFLGKQFLPFQFLQNVKKIELNIDGIGIELKEQNKEESIQSSLCIDSPLNFLSGCFIQYDKNNVESEERRGDVEDRGSGEEEPIGDHVSVSIDYKLFEEYLLNRFEKIESEVKEDTVLLNIEKLFLADNGETQSTDYTRIDNWKKKYNYSVIKCFINAIKKYKSKYSYWKTFKIIFEKNLFQKYYYDVIFDYWASKRNEYNTFEDELKDLQGQVYCYGDVNEKEELNKQVIDLEYDNKGDNDKIYFINKGHEINLVKFFGDESQKKALKSNDFLSEIREKLSEQLNNIYYKQQPDNDEIMGLIELVKVPVDNEVSKWFKEIFEDIKLEKSSLKNSIEKFYNKIEKKTRIISNGENHSIDLKFKELSINKENIDNIDWDKVRNAYKNGYLKVHPNFFGTEKTVPPIFKFTDEDLKQQKVYRDFILKFIEKDESLKQMAENFEIIFRAAHAKTDIEAMFREKDSCSISIHQKAKRAQGLKPDAENFFKQTHSPNKSSRGKDGIHKGVVIPAFGGGIFPCFRYDTVDNTIKQREDLSYVGLVYAHGPDLTNTKKKGNPDDYHLNEDYEHFKTEQGEIKWDEIQKYIEEVSDTFFYSAIKMTKKNEKAICYVRVPMIGLGVFAGNHKAELAKYYFSAYKKSLDKFSDTCKDMIFYVDFFDYEKKFESEYATYFISEQFNTDKVKTQYYQESVFNLNIINKKIDKTAVFCTIIMASDGRAWWSQNGMLDASLERVLVGYKNTETLIPSFLMNLFGDLFFCDAGIEHPLLRKDAKIEVLINTNKKKEKLQTIPEDKQKSMEMKTSLIVPENFIEEVQPQGSKNEDMSMFKKLLLRGLAISSVGFLFVAMIKYKQAFKKTFIDFIDYLSLNCDFIKNKFSKKNNNISSI